MCALVSTRSAAPSVMSVNCGILPGLTHDATRTDVEPMWTITPPPHQPQQLPPVNLRLHDHRPPSSASSSNLLNSSLLPFSPVPLCTIFLVVLAVILAAPDMSSTFPPGLIHLTVPVVSLLQTPVDCLFSCNCRRHLMFAGTSIPFDCCVVFWWRPAWKQRRLRLVCLSFADGLSCCLLLCCRCLSSS